jgi:hypothetical protein
MATNPTATALANAKKALESANKFTASVTGGKPNAFAPKEKTDYSHAHEARKAPEFLGVRSDEASELNTALKTREDAKKALDQ